MLFKSSVLLALASAVIAAPSIDIRDEKPDPSQVTIKGITTSGSGCPQGSVGKFLSSDRQTFTLIFDQYQVQIGPGTQVADARKFCQINLQLHYPSGYQYSILNTIFRGYAALDSGVTGKQEATYYFSGQSNQISTSSSFYGPFDENYSIVDTTPVSSTVWSPCGADLPINIKSSISLSSSKASAKGLMTDDSIDGKITWVTGVSWRRCK